MDNLEQYTKQQLMSYIKSLEAHNIQLKNIINKKNKNKERKQRRTQKRNFDFQKCKFRHVFLKFLYLGWDYQGFVAQEDTTDTIEHQIFNALLKTCLIESRATSKYHRCGRTDKGVSAFSQVISLDIRSKSKDVENELNYCKMLNSILPDNIQFIAWCPVEENFSARFDCRKRTYKYFFPRGQLNIEAMKIGSKYLEGTHDFRNLCKMDVNNGVVEFKRTILSTDIISLDENDNQFSVHVLTIIGNAFLWHQIRCIVGILILIGQGKEKPEVIIELLDITANPRKPDYHMASEIPLNLYDCQYDNIKWIYDKEALDVTIRKLSNFWTICEVKSAMVKYMLGDLPTQHCSSDQLSEVLIPGVKPKKYMSVMKRQLCSSLEDKIQNSLKRRRKKENI